MARAERTSCMFLRAFNLIVATVWLVLGLAVLANGWRRGAPTIYFPLGNTRISLGWLALFLAAYNVLRWWSMRWSLANRRAREGIETSRRRQHHTEQAAPQEPSRAPKDQSEDRSR